MDKPPIGFETQQMPPGFGKAPEPKEEKFDEEDNFGPVGDFNGPMATMDEFDPVALGLHDGSLQQQLAYSMQQAVDEIRAV